MLQPKRLLSIARNRYGPHQQKTYGDGTVASYGLDHRIAIRVAVHLRSAQFTPVRTCHPTCGANANDPRELAPLKLLIRGFGRC